MKSRLVCTKIERATIKYSFGEEQVAFSFFSVLVCVRHALTAAFPTPYATLKRYRNPPADETLTIRPCWAGTIILAACHAAM